VQSSLFYSNTAVNGGGGITSGSALTVTGSAFDSNSAAAGGAIENHNYASLVVESSSFFSNTAVSEGGGIINYDGDVRVSDGTFSGNSAYSGGGVSNASVLTMTHSFFSGNTAASDGGGLLNLGSAALSSATFTGNSAYSDPAGYGGAIENYGVLTLTSSAFSANRAHFNGGALENWDGVTTITDTTFILNFASAGGAIVNNTNSTLTVTNSVFRGNASDIGGGIYNDNDSLLAVVHSAFYTNTAANSGGGINNIRAATSVISSTFSENSASYGGGIRNDAAMTVTLSAFDANLADFGGGIHTVGEDSRLVVDRSAFSANTAVHYGAGIYNGSALIVANSTFSDNSGDAGGGIYNADAARVDNSTFYNNGADDFGGGIINYTGTLTLTNATFSGNWAGSGGGGLANDAELHFRNTIIAYSASGGDCLDTGAIHENVNNLVEDGSCSATLSGDPRLAGLDDNGGPTWTIALWQDSPAIDAGDNSTCLPADQRAQSRDDWYCDLGAFELTLADSHTVAKNIPGPGVYTFGPTRVRLEVFSAGSLADLTIVQTDEDHPGRTGSSAGNGVGWGQYFSLYPNDGANGTFSASLTLPTLFSPDGSDKVCRYISGITWDCAADSFSTSPFDSITRQDVDAFSEWAAGSDVGPTVLRLVSLRAISGGMRGPLLLMLVVAAILLFALGYVSFQRR